MNVGALLDSRVALVLEEMASSLCFKNGMRVANIIGREGGK